MFSFHILKFKESRDHFLLLLCHLGILIRNSNNQSILSHFKGEGLTQQKTQNGQVRLLSKHGDEASRFGQRTFGHGLKGTKKTQKTVFPSGAEPGGNPVLEPRVQMLEVNFG